MKNNLLQVLTPYGRILPGWLLPRLEEELGPRSEKLQPLVRVLGLAEVESAIPSVRGQVGRPPRDRPARARAFVAQAIYNLPTTGALLEMLKADESLRRTCGGESRCAVPGESVFSRAFGEFAATELPQRVLGALIARTRKDRLIGHISPAKRDGDGGARAGEKPGAERFVWGSARQTEEEARGAEAGGATHADRAANGHDAGGDAGPLLSG